MRFRVADSYYIKIMIQNIKTSLYILFLMIATSLFMTSCKKQNFLTEGGAISYNVDTFLFDTVFTAQGSSTRQLMIYNKENQSIKISSLRLKDGSNSPFYFTVNGHQGPIVKDIEIAAKDSVWVFLGVEIDPTNEDGPFIVNDELIATVNGNDFNLPINAFGQNAYYIVDSVLKTDTWLTDKPYVIINNALIDENETLTIPAGCRVYVNGNSRLYVLGTLKVNGTLEQPVIFQGDRLDRKKYIGADYAVGGEWGGIYFFKQSQNNVINYAQINNAGASTRLGTSQALAAAIQLDEDSVKNGTPKLRLTNTIIKNAQGYGIIAFNSSMYAENNLVIECGSDNICILEGGQYEINDCTLVSFGWDMNKHTDGAALRAMNYRMIDQNNYVGAHLQLTVNNSIIYGSLKNELVASKVDDFNAVMTINNSLLKYDDSVEPFVQQNNTILNENPLFKTIPAGKNYVDWDFQLTAESPVIGKGIQVGSLNTDLLGRTRNNPTSMGCYEFE